MRLTIHFESMRKMWPKSFPRIFLKVQSKKISAFCFRPCCMTLVQKLGILSLPNYERVKTGRRSPLYLNCSHILYLLWFLFLSYLLELCILNVLLTFSCNNSLAWLEWVWWLCYQISEYCREDWSILTTGNIHLERLTYCGNLHGDNLQKKLTVCYYMYFTRPKKKN